MATITGLLGRQVKIEAKLAHTRWSRIMDAEDIEQEIWLFILENPTVQKYLESANKKQIKAALRRRADIICSKERIDYERFSGNFIYRPAEVSALLRCIKEREELPPDERIDLELGLKDLKRENPRYYDVLIGRYIKGEMVAYKSLASRALETLTTYMNRTRSQRAMDQVHGHTIDQF